MRIEFVMTAGDATGSVVLPLPFNDENGARIGTVVEVRFDGVNTVGIAEVSDQWERANEGRLSA